MRQTGNPAEDQRIIFAIVIIVIIVSIVSIVIIIIVTVTVRSKGETVVLSELTWSEEDAAEDFSRRDQREFTDQMNQKWFELLFEDFHR